MTTDNEIIIHPTAIVCAGAILSGNITIKAGTIVHPKAIIRATTGSIIIGENNTIEETVLIENTNESGAPLEIGDENLFEVGAVVRCAQIGSRNSIGIQSVIGNGAILTDGCSLGARCTLLQQAALPPRTAIYGQHNQRRTALQDPPSQLSLMEVVRKMLPSYHKLYTSRKTGQ